MSTHSKIEWTEATWNPVRGCTKISPRYEGRMSSPFGNIEMRGARENNLKNISLDIH